MSEEKQLWRVAGRKRRNFESPEQMWQVACAYFDWCDKNPLYITEQKKKVDKGTILTDSKGNQSFIPAEELIEIPKKRMYTKSGFCVFAGVASNYLRLMGYEDRDNGGLSGNEEWMTCLDMIINVIQSQNIEGAAVGQFNSSIVMSILGLTQKVEEKVITEEVKQVFKIDDIEFTLE